MSCDPRVLQKVHGLVFRYSTNPCTVSVHNKHLLTGMLSYHSQRNASAHQPSSLQESDLDTLYVFRRVFYTGNVFTCFLSLQVYSIYTHTDQIL